MRVTKQPSKSNIYNVLKLISPTTIEVSEI